VRLALEPECLENPTATSEQIPSMGADSIGDTQLFVISDDWRRSTLLSSRHQNDGGDFSG